MARTVHFLYIKITLLKLGICSATSEAFPSVSNKAYLQSKIKVTSYQALKAIPVQILSGIQEKPNVLQHSA